MIAYRSYFGTVYAMVDLGVGMEMNGMGWDGVILARRGDLGWWVVRGGR